MMYKT